MPCCRRLPLITSTPLMSNGYQSLAANRSNTSSNELAFTFSLTFLPNALLLDTARIL